MIVQEIDHRSEHLASVKALGTANSQTLGFFPEGAFDDYARRRQIIIALDESQICIGYLLYRISQERAIIVHLCVDSSKRTGGIGTQLFAHLKDSVKDLRGIGLRCRRDYEASKLWQKLGFVAQYDQPGRGKTRTDLTYWWFDNGHPTLFTDVIAEQVKSKICVAIDTNVFFDLYDASRVGHAESSSLQADWLSDAIELCVTDEILNDINRSQDESERLRGRELVKQFTVLPCDQTRLPAIAESLKEFFQEQMTPRDESDRWQIARTIASNTQFFVTRDQNLLDLPSKVYDTFGITILRATDLIIHLDELRREIEYAPQRLAGTLSEIRLVQSGQESKLTEKFRAVSLGENKSSFHLHLRNILANPDRNACYVALDVNKEAIALFAYDRRQPETLGIPLLRIAHNPVATTLVRYLIFRSVVHAAKENRIVTSVTDPYQNEVVTSALTEDGFLATREGAIKISLPVAETARELSNRLLKLEPSSDEVKKYCGGLADNLRSSATMASVDATTAIERLLWPAKIIDAYIPTFLVPIKPEWAKELFDDTLADQTLFGATQELGLSREGVYYRAKAPAGGLKAPARILWYVSYGKSLTGTGHVRACSRLDDVIVDNPKSLYRRFRRLGIYDWNHVFELAKKNVNNEIMALRFSDTELLKNPIEWNELQRILRRFGCKTQIQSPVAVAPELFAELYRHGTKIPTEENR